MLILYYILPSMLPLYSLGCMLYPKLTYPCITHIFISVFTHKYRFITLKRTLLFFVFLFDPKKNWNIMRVLSILLITCGAIVAGAEHLEDDLNGYILIMINNIFAAIGLHMIKSLNDN